MASNSVARALKRSAISAAKRVPKRTSTEVAVSEHVVKARENFTYFCSAMGKPPAPHMLEWHREFVTGQSNEFLLDVAGQNTCLLSPRGPLDLDTLIPTPEGWVPLRHIRVGMRVFTPEGKPTRVTDRVDYGEEVCWEAVFSDGTSLVCDDSHRWLVRSATARARRWRETTLEEIRTVMRSHEAPRTHEQRVVTRRARPGEKPWLDKIGEPRWEAPVAEAVNYPRRDLPVDPYLIGVLLTRGTMAVGYTRFTSADPDVAERVRAAIPAACVMNQQKKPKSVVWSIYGRPGHGDRSDPLSKNPLRWQLRDLGMWFGANQERMIPESYLLGSIPQRIALLQGILDTAGAPRPSGTVHARFRSRQLAGDVAELVRSLGGLAQPMTPAPGRNGGNPSPRLRIVLPKDVEPFHCRAKAEAYAEALPRRSPYALTRRIVDIRPAGMRQIGCITVADESHQFLAQDYVVSCNSAKSTELGLLCAWLIGRHTLARRLLRILYVSYNVDVSRAKSLAIKNTILSEDYQAIFPMVRLSKTRTADELWAIDFEFAEIDVRGEDAFTIACAGLRGTITSKRSNLVVLDDLIKSKKDISNPEARREMEANWNAVIVPTMFQGARAIALGTRFHFDDMFATTFIEKNGWRTITQGALLYDDEGRVRSYWPQMWALDYLLELQHKDRISFAYQYMNQAVRSTELGVSPELFVRGEISESFDQIGVGMDLSSGLRERNDYTVFVLGGRDGDKAHIIDLRRVRSMGNIEKVEALCELLLDWNLLGQDDNGKYRPTFSEVTIWPEAVSYQKSFEGDFKRIMYDEWGLTNVRISPVRGVRGDKLARFRGVMGLFETRKVVFNKYRDFQVLFDEVMNMGHSPHDDCADALQILLMKLMGKGPAQVEYL